MAGEDYRQIKLRFTDDTQERYESIRPLLLFEDSSAREQAKQTGHTARTLRKRRDRFLRAGMRGLLEQDPAAGKILSERAKLRLSELLGLYPDFGYSELARILYKDLGEAVEPRKIAEWLKDARPPLQKPLPFHQHQEPRLARLEVVRLFYSGWSPTSIAHFLKLSRRYVYSILERFEEEQFASLQPQSRAPKRPAQKVTFRLMAMIYHLQREYPRAGEFRIWGLLRQQFQELGEPEPDLSRRTVGRCMHINRQLHPELVVQDPPAEAWPSTAHLPYRPTHLHHIWYTDIRVLDTHLEGKNVYSICVLDGYSRAILSGAVSLSKATWAVLRVLHAAVRSFGRPDLLVTDNEGQFKGGDFQALCQSLEIEHKPIEPRKSYQTLIEPFFGVQRRLADFQFTRAQSLEDFQRLHAEFLDTYNHTPHWTLIQEKRPHDKPAEILGSLGCRPLTETEVDRLFGSVLFHRSTDRCGYVQFQRWRFYAEEGLPRTAVQLWVSPEELMVEHQQTLLAVYPCKFEPSTKSLRKLEDKPRLLPTRFRSPQLELFDPEWNLKVVVFRLEDPPPRQFPTRRFEQLELYDAAL